MAQSWQAAAGGGHLWIVVDDSHAQPAEDKAAAVALKLLHRGVDDSADQLHLVERLSGRLATPPGGGGLLADSRAALLTYRSGPLQRVTAQADDLGHGYRYEQSLQPGLPEDVAARSLCLVGDTPWALVRAESPTVLQRLIDEHSPASSPGNVTAPPEPPAGEAATPPLLAVAGLDVLLVLRGREWEIASFPLPEHYAPDRDTWLVGDPDDGISVNAGQQPRPPILLRRQSGEESALIVSRWESPQGWSDDTYSFPDSTGKSLRAVAVDGLLVVAQPAASDPQGPPDSLRLQIAVLERGQSTAIATVMLPALATARWDILPTPTGLLLLADPRPAPADDADADADEPGGHADDPLRLVALSLDLRGNVSEPFTLVQGPPPGRPVADYIVLAASVATALLVVLIFWRRNPRRQLVELPETLRVAPLTQRFLAAMIDLLPILFAVAWWYDLSIRELMGVRWPSPMAEPSGRTLEDIQPSLIAIGAFTLYTLLFEITLRWTPGKRLTRLQITDLTGRPATRVQILARNLLKPLDLIAPILLLIPLIVPSRQRMGDLLARTLITTPTPDPAEDEEDQNQDAEEHQD